MSVEYRSRAELIGLGARPRAITAAVRSGTLIRARRDRYLPEDTAEDVVRAVWVGGRLTCLSLLALLGVFVLANELLHVHVDRTASRFRSPHSRRVPLEPGKNRKVRLHWTPLSVPVGRSTTVDLRDALAHSILCQAPRAAVATIDSALNKGLITAAQLADVFALVPARFHVLRPLVDGRAESGSESMLRLMLRGLGCTVELQVVVEGVGRVDLIVDGWLAIECDSAQFHSGWEAQERDRRRDLALAARGYSTLRPTANMIFHEPEMVLAAIRGLLATRSAAPAI